MALAGERNTVGILFGCLHVQGNEFGVVTCGEPCCFTDDLAGCLLMTADTGEKLLMSHPYIGYHHLVLHLVLYPECYLF